MMARYGAIVARVIVSFGAIALFSCCSIRTEELHRMALTECPDLIAAADGVDLSPSDKALVDWCKAQMMEDK